MDRREFIKGSAGLAIGAAGVAASGRAAMAGESGRAGAPGRAGGRLRHSVCRWCYGGMALEDLCAKAKEIGIESVELLTEKEWNVPGKFGLTCAVAMGPNPIPRGWNRVEHHDEFIKESERLLPLIKAAGIPNMIVFSGNRDGQEDREGARNCIAGLRRIMPLAEQLGVTVVMELLNSKDHADYQCDRTAWGAAVARGVGSGRFRLLYDIYHMQRMEGDVIETIQKNITLIGHFHTGGVPGRAEIDDSQELNYAAICRAIADTGYAGFVGQEFIPRKDPMASLRRAVEICTV